MIAATGRPQLLLTFELTDGSKVSKTCDVYEAIAQLAEAKSYPSKFLDFHITPAKLCAGCPGVCDLPDNDTGLCSDCERKENLS